MSFFRVNDTVLKKAARMGMPVGHLRDKLADMVAEASPVTHPLGNYRYNEYVFQVHGRDVLDINPYAQSELKFTTNCAACHDTGRVMVFDVNEDGTETPSSIPCPDCGKPQIFKMR